MAGLGSMHIASTFLSLIVVGLLSSACSQPASAPAPAAPTAPAGAATAPVALQFLEGEWEYLEPTNLWRMKVAWNAAAGRYEGTLTRNGVLSAEVGFTVGELVWTATPQPDGSVGEGQKFRAGAGGVSTGEEWHGAKIDLAQSGGDKLVSEQQAFARVK
jgi:hypothetical protein